MKLKCVGCGLVHDKKDRTLSLTLLSRCPKCGNKLFKKQYIRLRHIVLLFSTITIIMGFML